MDISQELINLCAAFDQPVPTKTDISLVVVDSRAVIPGSLFVALRGEKTDGHNFLQEAVQKGARALLIQSDYRGHVPSVEVVIRVPDTLEALQMMAKSKVVRSKGRLLALTGSLGKTTTKEFLRTIASSKWKTFATSGNQNSQVGLAQTILNSLEGDEEVLIVEMGMSGVGHIKKLVDIAPPDIAMILEVALQHVQFFSNGLEGIADAKLEIFSHPKTQLGLVNLDTNYACKLFSTYPISKRGYTSKGASNAWISLDVLEDKLCFVEDGAKIYFPKPVFPVRHVYDNLLAAVAGARALGMSWDEIKPTISKLQLPKRRLEFHQFGSISCINDAYNAPEPSVISALDYLDSFKNRRRVAVLGQMKELAEYSREVHERVAKYALGRADLLLCLGEDSLPMFEIWKEASRPVFWAKTYDELCLLVDSKIASGDVLLLKGASSNGLWRLLDHPKINTNKISDSKS